MPHLPSFAANYRSAKQRSRRLPSLGLSPQIPAAWRFARLSRRCPVSARSQTAFALPPQRRCVSEGEMSSATRNGFIATSARAAAFYAALLRASAHHRRFAMMPARRRSFGKIEDRPECCRSVTMPLKEGIALFDSRWRRRCRSRSRFPSLRRGQSGPPRSLSPRCYRRL